MSVASNDSNPQGSRWFQQQLYGESHEKAIYPEEDYQVAAMPKTLLHRELGVRLGVIDAELMTWHGKEINFSAVSDQQLLHHIGTKLVE